MVRRTRRRRPAETWRQGPSHGRGRRSAAEGEGGLVPKHPLIPAKAGTQGRVAIYPVPAGEYATAFYVYILASGKNGTLYTGSTEDLAVRIEMHKTKVLPGFTAKYGVDRLVWFESHPSRESAFTRERQIKEWRRAWKLRLIEIRNSQWEDLSLDLERSLLDEEERRGW